MRVLSCGMPLFLLVCRLLAADAAPDVASPNPLRPGAPPVGRLGFTSALEITGNRAIPSEHLRFALAGSYEYLKAAHPSAPLKDYVAAVESLLVRGYQNMGFRDARVSAVPSPDGARLRVQVVEGPRFMNGEVRILGSNPRTAGELVAALTGKPIASTNELALKVGAFVAKRNPPKPKPEVEAAVQTLARQVPTFSLGTGQPGANTSASGTNWLRDSLASMLSTFEPPAAWESGKPFSFNASGLKSHQKQLTRILGERGQWQTGVKTEFEINPATGRVNLVHTLTEMPSAVIGKIQVVGQGRDTAGEIIAAAGLKPGEPFTSETLRQSHLALWNSARFLDFDVVAQPAADGGAALDLTVNVQDFPGMQPLREPLTREQKALVKLAEWMTVELPKREYAIRLADSRGNGAVLAMSPATGTALLLNSESPDQLVGLHFGKDDGLVVATSGKRAAARPLRGISSPLVVSLWLTPSERDQVADGMKPFSMGVGFSFRSFGAAVNGLKQAGLKADILVCPAALCSRFRNLTGLEVKFHDGSLSLDQKMEDSDFGNLRIHFRFLEATGELLELTAEMEPKDSDGKGSDKYSARMELKPGEVRRIRQLLETAQQGHAAAELARESFVDVVTRWPAVERFIHLAARNSRYDPDTLRWSAHATEQVLVSVASLFTPEGPAKATEDTEFYIPPDPSAGTSVLAIMMGAFYHQWAQELWPAEAWPSKLGREIFNITAGNTRYTSRVLDELAQDPTLGPFGSFVAAQLLAKIHPAGARQFLERARRHASSDDLRKELNLLLNLQGRGSELLRSMVDRMAHLDAQSIEALAATLGAEYADEVRAWRKDLATARNTTPAEALIPHLLNGWEHGGREAFLRNVDQIFQDTQVDGFVAAALVNGEPVSRKWLMTLGPALKLNRRIVVRPAIPSGKPPADGAEMLEALITLRLVHQDYLQRGGTVSPELLQKTLNELAEGNPVRLETVFQRASGTQDDLRLMVQQWLAYRALEGRLKAGLKPVTEEEISASGAARLAEVADHRHLQFLRAAKVSGGRERLEKMRAEAVEKGFDDLWKRLQKDSPADLKLNEYPELDRRTLNETLTRAAFGLSVGQTSELIEVADYVFLLHLVSQGASAQRMADERKEVLAGIQRSRLDDKLREYVEDLRAVATIALLDYPPMPTVPPPANGTTRLEGESLKVTAKEQADFIPMSMGRWGAEHWSGGRQVMVNCTEGGWVEWEFEAAAEGETRFVLHATRANNCGRIRVALDGRDFDPVIDLYGCGVIPSGPRSLGQRSLSAGTHKLRISMVGRNPEASAMDFGFDALDLIPLRARAREGPGPK